MAFSKFKDKSKKNSPVVARTPEGPIRVKLPQGREVIGIITQRCGGSRMFVSCMDGKTRNCRVPGRKRRGLWLREGDAIIIEPWEFDDDKGDVLFKYAPIAVSKLKAMGKTQYRDGRILIKMRTIQIENISKIRKAVPKIENKIKINIQFGKGCLNVKGNELNEYLCEQIIQAIDFGFEAEDALLLTNEDFVLEFIDVKEHTNRKNLKEVRARLIGRDGKARKTIENLTGSEVVINGNTVGVIVDSEHLDSTIQAIESLIHGAKHGNVFSYLEKQNVGRRKYDSDDLGLKEGVDNQQEGVDEDD